MTENVHVPAELVDDAVDAWHEMPRPLALDDQMRHILAAVLPRHEYFVRKRIAEEIDLELTADGDCSSWDGGMLRATQIARGESQPTGDPATCRLYDDGQGGTVRVHGEKPLDEEGQAALRDLLRAARRRHEEEKAAERREIERQVREQLIRQAAGLVVHSPAGFGIHCQTCDTSPLAASDGDVDAGFVAATILGHATRPDHTAPGGQS